MLVTYPTFQAPPKQAPYSGGRQEQAGEAYVLQCMVEKDRTECINDLCRNIHILTVREREI
jgi:hypothetical protein